MATRCFAGPDGKFNTQFLDAPAAPAPGWWDGIEWANPPQGFTEVPSQPANPSAVWAAGVWSPLTPATTPAEIIAFRDAHLAAGYTDPTAAVPSSGLTFACDDSSRASITALGAAAGIALALNTAPAPSFIFIAGAASSVTGQAIAMSPAQAFAWANRIMAWVTAVYLYCNTMIEAVQAGNQPADYTAGWP